MLLTLFGISVIIFLLLRVMPGNIVDILYDAAGYVNPREKAKIEAELGIDKPIVVQYATWISGLAQGDLGYSYVSERPALEEIAPRIPITAKLAGLALCFSVLIGIEAAFLMGGLIVTETVFNVPGVARYLVTALTQRDYPIVQNLVMFVATIVVLINFMVDMLYAVLDPRIKYSES